MKLVDPSGNEVTSKQNENAQELEKQLSKKVEKLLEPILNKVKLSGAQVPQQQLVQISSMAHQMLFNRMIYNLIQKIGIEDIDELLSEDDVEELKTDLSNQIKMVDSNEMQEMMKKQQQQQQAGPGPEGNPDSKK
ncbi:MAG: hypothetical protein R3224_04900 [Balneolaceae bacterium]|nr:hypothetical protein [Balneolaceae bacterium]